MTLAEYIKAVTAQLEEISLPPDAKVSRLSIEAARHALKDALRYLPRALARAEAPTTDFRKEGVAADTARGSGAVPGSSSKPLPPPGDYKRDEGAAVTPVIVGVRADGSATPPSPPIDKPARARKPCGFCGGTDHDGRRHRGQRREAPAAPAAESEAPAEEPGPASIEAAKQEQRTDPSLDSAPSVSLIPVCQPEPRLSASGPAPQDARDARVMDIAAAAQRLERRRAGLADLAPGRQVPAAPVKQERSVCEKAPVARLAPDREALEGWAEEFHPELPELPPAPPRAAAALVMRSDGSARVGRPPLPVPDPRDYSDAEIDELTEVNARTYRSVVVDGRSHEDVAEEEGTTEKAIYVRLHTARKKLAENRNRAPLMVTPPRPLTLVAGAGSDPTPAQQRVRAKLRVIDGRVRAKTIPQAGSGRPLRFAPGELEAGAELLDPTAYDRPPERGDCQNVGENAARPCPWVSCPHHLALDVNPDTGAMKLNFPHLEVWEMAETCSLDVADRGGITLEEVGAILNLTRERIRQVEVHGLAKIKDQAGDELGLPPERACAGDY